MFYCFREREILNGFSLTNLDYEWDVKDIPRPEYSSDDVVLVIDGDIICFKISSACEKKSIVVTNAKGNTKEFKTRTKFKEWCKKLGKDFNDYSIEDKKIVEPLNYCINTLNRSIDKLMLATGATKAEFYIDGKSNFRKELPLIDIYKDRHDDRPEHLSALKEHILRFKGGYRIKDRETDDFFQQRLYELYVARIKCIGYTNDKDAKQNYQMDITLYNPDDGSIKTFDKGVGSLWETSAGIKGSGMKWLMFQLILYDKVDSYCMNQFYEKRYGEKSFYNDFKDLARESDVLSKAVSLLKSNLPEKIEYISWNGVEVSVNWLGLAEIYFQCCYMKVYNEDTTTFESLLKEYDVDY